MSRACAGLNQYVNVHVVDDPLSVQLLSRGLYQVRRARVGVRVCVHTRLSM